MTRDRLYTRAFWGVHEFLLVDTGGVLTVPSSSSMGSDALAITSGGGSDAVTQALKEAAAAGLPSLIEKQAAAAVEDASSVIFVVDGQVNCSPVDISVLCDTIFSLALFGSFLFGIRRRSFIIPAIHRFTGSEILTAVEFYRLVRVQRISISRIG